MATGEPTLGDVLAGIATLSTETKTRHEALASESRARDLGQTDRVVRLETKMEQSVAAMTQGLTTLGQAVSRLESAFPKVQRQASDADLASRAAVKSHLDLEEAHEARWRSLMEGHDAMIKRLDRQDLTYATVEREKKEALERAEAVKKEAREQESIAAKRVETKRAADEKAAQAKREHDEKMVQARTPRVVAAIMLLGTVTTVTGAYFSARLAHEPTEAKITANTQQLASIQRRVETVAQAVDAPAVPGSDPAPPVGLAAVSSVAAPPPSSALGVPIVQATHTAAPAAASPPATPARNAPAAAAK